MASSAAQAYFNSFPLSEQDRIRASWGGQDRTDEWYQNAVNAGAVQGVAAPGSTQAEEGGNIAPYQGAAPSSEWLGKRKPTAQELRKWAIETGRSEDYARFPDAAVSGWINTHWDVGKGSFVNNYGDLVDKPDERGPNTPPDRNGTGDAGNWGAGGTGSAGSPAGGLLTAPAPTQTPQQIALADMQRALEDKFMARSGEFGFANGRSPSSGIAPDLYASSIKSGGLWWGNDKGMFDPNNAGTSTAPAVAAPAPAAATTASTAGASTAGAASGDNADVGYATNAAAGAPVVSPLEQALRKKSRIKPDWLTASPTGSVPAVGQVGW